MDCTEPHPLVAEIAHLEEVLLQAMLTSNVEQLDLLLADDLIFTDHTGRLLDKQSDLDAHRSGLLKIRELTLQDRTIRLINDNAAVVTARVSIKGAFDSAEFSSSLRFTRVWACRGARWAIVAAQSSEILEQIR